MGTSPKKRQRLVLSILGTLLLFSFIYNLVIFVLVTRFNYNISDSHRNFFNLVSIAAYIDCGLLALYVILRTSGNYLNDYVPKFSYSKYGNLENWYDKTFAYNQRKLWLNNVIHNLKDVIQLANIKVALSPSGNQGKYEYNIAREFSKTRFIVTDISIQPDHIPSSENYEYLSAINNAMHVKTYLTNIGISKVELIWDIKGAFWHNHRSWKLNKLLKSYLSILEDNGFIVFDAYDEIEKDKIKINKRRNVSEWDSYIEDSTYTKIKKNLHRNKTFKENFNISIIGEGEAKMAVLKKI